jgi:predicted nuclease with RNAse H fold
VAGIDVGGPRKGFHAVALRDGQYLDKFKSRDADEMVSWCQGISATAVGIDAPCRWSETGRARPAEREIAKQVTSCFATPTQARAGEIAFYGWMLNGAKLYGALEASYKLFIGEPVADGELICFETFPQAVACALAGELVSAKKKGVVRRERLKKEGISLTEMTNIDTVDAALCALTARYLLAGQYRGYGEVRTGFILVPRRAPQD